MFAFSRHLHHAVLLLTSLLGLAATPFTHAKEIDAINTCFNYLNVQDYARAEQAGIALLKHIDLSRTEQRNAQICLGRAYDRMGRDHDALSAFQKVEELSQTTQELAIAYAFLGRTFESINDLDRAELYDQRAIMAFKKLGNKAEQASTISNLALVIKKRGDTSRALTLFLDALNIQPNDTEKSLIINNIASIYYEKKDYSKSEKLFRQAIKIAQVLGDTHQLAQAQINLGGVLTKQGKLNGADKELTAGYNAIRLIGDKRFETQACLLFFNLAITQKNFPLAREWLAKAEPIYREIGDTVNADAVAKYLAEN